MTEYVRSEIRDSVGILTLHRPESLNAWHVAMQREFAGELERLRTDDRVRAVVITGAGDRAFCAGQDLAETAGLDADGAEEWLTWFESLYDTVRRVYKPVVAALNGVAAGSGYQLSLLCDVRIAHPGVRLGQPEVKSGIPSITGTWLTLSMLGQSRTTELMLTGRLMEAEEAHRIGLIHHVVPAPEVLPKALEVAGELAAQPPGAVALTKERMRRITEDSFRESFRAAREIDRRAWASGEPQEMMRKFFADRVARKEGS